MRVESPGRSRRPVLNYATDSAGVRPDELAPLTPGMRVIRALLLLVVTVIVFAIVFAITAIHMWVVG